MEILIWIAAALALLFWGAFCWRSTSTAKTVVKTASVAFLALAAVPIGIPVLVVALALGALGDFALSRDGDRWFLPGMGAFGAAHLAYVALLWPTATFPLVEPMLVLLAFGAGMALLLWQRAGALRVPVLVYLLVILAMGMAGLSQPILTGHGPLLLAAVLFITSDTLLATEMFLLPKSHKMQPLLPFLVWPTYWLAQLGFLWGFAAI